MKYIFLDWSYFQFRAIHSWIKNQGVPPTYIACSVICNCLKAVSVDREDVIIIAIDSKTGSWRKEVDVAYKADRKEKRAKISIDWDYHFKQFDYLLDNIETSTVFHIVGVDKLEADDIIAYGVRKFANNDCIVISTDSDFEQLAVFKNVQLFSPIKMQFKKVKCPHRVLANKIRRERTDNLISPIQSQKDYDRRDLIVNLMKLPEEVEKPVDERLSNLPEKQWDLSLFRFPKLQDRLMGIYEKPKQLTIM